MLLQMTLFHYFYIFHCTYVCVCVCVRVCAVSFLSIILISFLLFSHSVVPNSLQPMDYSPPGSCVHEILQARMMEWVAISSSREHRVACI